MIANEHIANAHILFQQYFFFKHFYEDSCVLTVVSFPILVVCGGDKFGYFIFLNGGRHLRLHKK